MMPTDDGHRRGPTSNPITPEGIASTPRHDLGAVPIVPLSHAPHGAGASRAPVPRPSRAARPGTRSNASAAGWLCPADEVAAWAPVEFEGFGFIAAERGCIRRLTDAVRDLIPAATNNPRALSALARLLFGLERLPFATPGLSVRLTIIQRPSASPSAGPTPAPAPISESCQQTLRIELSSRQFILTHTARPAPIPGRSHRTDADGLPSVRDHIIMVPPTLRRSLPHSVDASWATTPASCAASRDGRWDRIDRFTERLLRVWNHTHCTMDIVDDHEASSAAIDWDIDRDQAQHDPWIRAFGHDNALWMHDRPIRLTRPGARPSSPDGEPVNEDFPEPPCSPD
ncbi:MAG: hypothetical protein ACK5WB_07790 [Phycisphaerales bacterium]|jgi:hypothetical protein|nr:hypothetical protein [Phycisphaeraceae bacterium]